MPDAGGAARELPGGVVTFVFTDIEGSTKLFRRLGDAYPALLETHNEIMREVWDDFDGAEVKTEGDAFFVAFADASAAIRASVTAIERLAAHPWPEDAVIKVRVGMHTGIGHPRDGDYIAFPVHQAARIGGVGHGGQVVVSPDTIAAAGDLDDVRLHDLGAYRVRDFDDPIHLFQAERAEAPTRFPDLRTAADVRHNLPSELPDLIGRAADLAGIREQLDEGRLVSIVGPGGVGKTLTALTTAASVVERFEHGAWFVDLSAHTEMSTLDGAIADALGTTADELDQHLGEREMLLVLDNAEQATADMARRVSGLLQSTERVSLLVTSREPLSLAAERVWRLDLVDDAAARTLFIDYATAADPSFVADEQLEAIDEVCRRLDGLPLAIELAAARVSAMSMDDLVASLDDSLRILRSRRRDLDERQRTATALVDWSYQLLDHDEQLVFRRLAVFTGTFDLDGATVCCADEGLDRIDVSDIVWSLVEKSLVLRVVEDGGTRYRYLATMRAFGHAAMEEAAELEAVRRAVAEWYLAIFDPEVAFTRVITRRMRAELDSIRGLVMALGPDDLGEAQRLAWSYGLYFRNTDPRRGVAEMMPMVDHLSSPGPAAGMMAIAGHLLNTMGDFEMSEQCLALGHELSAGHDDGSGAGWLANVAALNAVRQGDVDAAFVIVDRALPVASPLARMSLTNTLGILLAESGDLDASRSRFDSVLAMSIEFEAIEVQAVAFGQVAETAHRAGDIERAFEATKASIELAAENAMPAQHAIAVVGAARLLADVERWREAIELHAGADRAIEETGINLFEADRVLSDQMRARAAEALDASELEEATRAGSRLTFLQLHERAVAALTSDANGEAQVNDATA